MLNLMSSFDSTVLNLRSYLYDHFILVMFLSAKVENLMPLMHMNCMI